MNSAGRKGGRGWIGRKGEIYVLPHLPDLQ
jgi:hypothetical protein